MSFRPRQLVAVALIGLALAVPAGVDAAPKKSTKPVKPAKVAICHATGDVEKPYKLITVSPKAAKAHLENADGDHGADFLAPASAKKSSDCVAPPA